MGRRATEGDRARGAAGGRAGDARGAKGGRSVHRACLIACCDCPDAYINTNSCSPGLGTRRSPLAGSRPSPEIRMREKENAPRAAGEREKRAFFTFFTIHVATFDPAPYIYYRCCM